MSYRPDASYRRERQRSRWRGQGGFTLIETLVAFAVLATLLSVMFRGVVTLRAGTLAFDTRTQDDVVARSILDDALGNRTLRAGTYAGTRDGRRWTMIAKAMDLSAQIPPASAPPAAPAGPGTLAGQPPPTSPGAPARTPTWTPQRLVVRVETHGRPVEVETIRLVKAD